MPEASRSGLAGAAAGIVAPAGRTGVDGCPRSSWIPDRKPWLALPAWGLTDAGVGATVANAASMAPVRGEEDSAARADAAPDSPAIAGTPMVVVPVPTPEPPGEPVATELPVLASASGTDRTPGASFASITPVSSCSNPSRCPSSCVTTESRSIFPGAPLVDQPQPAAFRSIQISPEEAKPSSARGRFP